MYSRSKIDSNSVPHNLHGLHLFPPTTIFGSIIFIACITDHTEVAAMERGFCTNPLERLNFQCSKHIGTTAHNFTHLSQPVKSLKETNCCWQKGVSWIVQCCALGLVKHNDSQSVGQTPHGMRQLKVIIEGKNKIIRLKSGEKGWGEGGGWRRYLSSSV